jgi:hypothetical protein
MWLSESLFCERQGIIAGGVGTNQTGGRTFVCGSESEKGSSKGFGTPYYHTCGEQRGYDGFLEEMIDGNFLN